MDELVSAILDAAVEGIVIIDARGTVESINPAALRMFGYAAEEVVGKNVSMLMPAPHRDEHDGYISEYLTTGTRKIIGIGRETTGRRKNGTEFPIELAVSEGAVKAEFLGGAERFKLEFADGFAPLHLGLGLPGSAKGRAVVAARSRWLHFRHRAKTSSLARKAYYSTASARRHVTRKRDVLRPSGVRQGGD